MSTMSQVMPKAAVATKRILMCRPTYFQVGHVPPLPVHTFHHHLFAVELLDQPVDGHEAGSEQGEGRLPMEQA